MDKMCPMIAIANKMEQMSNCAGGGCAWWHSDEMECAILSIAKTLMDSEMREAEKQARKRYVDKVG